MSEKIVSLDDYRPDPIRDAIVDSLTPTNAQNRAMSEVKDWFINRSREQQVFRLFGYAGTGKTTITKFVIKELGLSMFAPPVKRRMVSSRFGDDYEDDRGPIPDVFFGAFTGKASYVMRKHGTPAQTIHSMIYSVLETTPEQIEEANKKLAGLIADSSNKFSMERTLALATIEALRSEIKKMKQPSFQLDPFSDVSVSKLIVLDEVSMVNQEMAAHVMSYGIPILVLGDPGQLPPVKGGEGAFTAQTPDVMLEEIHRQALDSPIIRLATMARLGQNIPMGKYSDTVYKLNKNNISASQMLNADQVICGLNATRYQLNAAMRAVAGFGQFGYLPTGTEFNGRKEKIICLKNMNTHGLVNGMFIDLYNIENIDDFSFMAEIITEDGRRIPDNFLVYKGEYLNHYEMDKDRADRDWQVKKGMVESTYGWAITGHKSQGSQWRNVLVYDDHWGRGAARRQWLYTAITRAEDGLVIAG